MCPSRPSVFRTAVPSCSMVPRGWYRCCLPYNLLTEMWHCLTRRFPLGYIKHLGGAATHHLRLILIRQGAKQPVDVLLGLKSYRPNMREVRAPQDTVSPNQRDHLRTIGIIDQPMIDA